MSNNVTTYRLTQDDLDDLDKKTKDGLEPLISALNLTLGQLVPVVNNEPDTEQRTITFQTQGTITDTFPLLIKTGITNPSSVIIGNFTAADRSHDYTVPSVVNGFYLTSSGSIAIRYISGLSANSSYTVTLNIS